jgi:hypothetical protein
MEPHFAKQSSGRTVITQGSRRLNGIQREAIE